MKDTKTTDARVTTREACALIGGQCGLSETIAVLRAAGVPHERVGTAYLWLRDAVLRLATHLTEDRDGERA